MTKEALKLSTKVIITDDNPKNEDPQVIRKEMKMELTKNEKIKKKYQMKKGNSILYKHIKKDQLFAYCRQRS